MAWLGINSLLPTFWESNPERRHSKLVQNASRATPKYVPYNTFTNAEMDEAQKRNRNYEIMKYLTILKSC